MTLFMPLQPRNHYNGRTNYSSASPNKGDTNIDVIVYIVVNIQILPPQESDPPPLSPFILPVNGPSTYLQLPIHVFSVIYPITCSFSSFPFIINLCEPIIHLLKPKLRK